MDIKTAKQIIEAAALAEDAVLMEGQHGIGKSQIVEQFAEDNNYHLEILFLSHQEVGDLIGIPHMVERDGVQITTWSVPIWLQRMNQAAAIGKRCVLFLDELNRAPIDVRQSALQLVLEGQIHEHCLPIVNDERTVIVSAINPSDEYQVDELDPALLDRFLKVEVEADLKAWLAWAKEAKVNKVVQDFLIEHSDRLHWTPADGGVGTSPRSWAKLGKFMDKVEQIPEEILFQVMKGKVGSEIGSQFYTFFKNYVDVIKIEDIEKIVQDNKDKVKNIEELGEIIAEVMENTEAIQKTEMVNQLRDKYKAEDETTMLPFYAYLYSLEMELAAAFLKGFRSDDSDGFKNLVQVDMKLNNKKLFTKIVSAADRK